LRAAVAAIPEKHDGALDPRSSIRVWLRLLSCTVAIEKVIQRRLAEGFNTSLARFDVLAALDRHPEGMTMGALSRSLLVSNGNTTQLIQKLAAEGLVQLAPGPKDRRSSVARLTEAGEAHFRQLAEVHHGWVDELMGGLDAEAREHLLEALNMLKTSIAAATPVERNR
jgi:DNA-binding MarR family transcriptional regulator